MKKYLLLTILFSGLFAFQSMAQRNRLQGSAAKNYKSWKSSKSESAILTKEHKRITGPKAKNHEHLKNDREAYSMVVFERGITIKGPRAKNKFPNRDEDLEMS